MSEFPIHGLSIRAALVASALSLGGCIIDADLGNAASESSGTTGGSITETGLGGSESTVTDMGPPGSGSGNVSTSGGSSTSGDASSSGEDPSAEGSTGEPIFECPGAPGEAQCSPSEQDCPAGFRCIPWATDGGIQPDSSTCVPLSDTPAARFEPCEIDAETCSDNCGAGDYCFPDTGSGGNLCLGICDQDGDDATCDAGEACSTCAKCFFGTCFGGCDPLDPMCPEEASTCEWGTSIQGFGCLPIPEGTSAVGEPCDALDRCEEGAMCISAELLDCGGPIGCCTELCDLEDGDPGCSNPAHECITLFFPDPAPPGQEHVGYCGPPELDPCLTPGNCPPEDIDDSVPWCSLANEGNCPTGLAVAGFFNGIDCEQTCTCEIPCMDDIDCPVPATGTATGECVTEPFGVGSPVTCLYPCDGGEVCPDGMTCSDELTGDFHCVWVSPGDPTECI
ncbi:MAG: hypothetical protein AAF799_06750 [Myxococcota bacterium]